MVSTTLTVGKDKLSEFYEAFNNSNLSRFVVIRAKNRGLIHVFRVTIIGNNSREMMIQGRTFHCDNTLVDFMHYLNTRILLPNASKELKEHLFGMISYIKEHRYISTKLLKRLQTDFPTVKILKKIKERWEEVKNFEKLFIITKEIENETEKISIDFHLGRNTIQE